jgi:hypothetical protein
MIIYIVRGREKINKSRKNQHHIKDKILWLVYQSYEPNQGYKRVPFAQMIVNSMDYERKERGMEEKRNMYRENTVFHALTFISFARPAGRVGRTESWTFGCWEGRANGPLCTPSRC